MLRAIPALLCPVGLLRQGRRWRAKHRTSSHPAYKNNLKDFLIKRLNLPFHYVGGNIDLTDYSHAWGGECLSAKISQRSGRGKRRADSGGEVSRSRVGEGLVGIR